MRVFALVLALATPAVASPVDVFVAAGPGLPELLRAEFGWFAHERVTIEVHFGLPVGNPLAGAGVTGWLLGASREGRPPTHTLTVSARGRLNVKEPDRFESGGGETLGAVAEVTGGYGLLTERHFLLRAQAGAMLFSEDGFAAGPQLVVTLGYAF